VVFMNKCDLVDDDELLDLVELEICKKIIANTPRKPIVTVMFKNPLF